MDIYVGKIVGTHGIKGELKVLSDFERKDLVFNVNQVIYINNKKHLISSHRVHQNKNLITIDSLQNINDVLKYIDKDVYVKRSDLHLVSYLMIDLIGFEVIDGDLLGMVKSILKTKNGYLLEVFGEKKFYIPFVPYYIKNVDIDNGKVFVTKAKELIF